MDPNQLTQKTQEALHDAQTKALRYGHTEIAPEHLLLALLDQREGLASGLLARLAGKLHGAAGQISVAGCEAGRPDVGHVGRIAEHVQVDPPIQLERVGPQDIAASVEVLGVEGTDRVGVGQHAVAAPADAALDQFAAHRAADDDRARRGLLAEGIGRAQRRGSSQN